jgi:hypothetical protein
VARYVVIPQRSGVRADAKSSLHPIKVETVGLQGALELELVSGQPRMTLPARIELDVKLLKSSNSLVDAELQRKLDSKKYPRLSGELVEVKEGASAGRQKLVGDLSMHGVTRRLELEVGVRAGEGDTVEIEGETVIDMREFGLVPPKFFILKVYPEVRIRAQLVAKKAEPEKTTQPIPPADTQPPG